jgi:hypothetical protein
MAELAHLNSVEQNITVAIKNSIDFEWIKCTGRSVGIVCSQTKATELVS